MTTVELGGCVSYPAASVVSPVAGPSSRPDDARHHCPYVGCDKSYTKASKLSQHVRSHTGERPFVCDYEGCGASYMRNEHLKAHQRRHQDPSEKPFACQESGCDSRFWTTSQLKNHVQACHSDNLSLATGTSAHEYQCTEAGCDMTFHKRKQLRQHIRDSHGGEIAPQQGQLFDEDDSAATHPFACQYPGCGKRFATNSKRKTHHRTHQDGRYTCSMDHTNSQDGIDEADGPFVYTFPTWSALQEHIRDAHPPICPWPGCGKRFQRQDNLRAHFRRHESRKLRLELEAKILEGSHESSMNHLRADLSDNSSASSSDEEEETDSPEATRSSSLHNVSPRPRTENSGLHSQNKNDAPISSTQPSSSTSPPSQSQSLTEEKVVQRAAQLRETRPRRGGVFRDLSSPTLSIVTSLSDKAGSGHLESVATSITSARTSAAAFPCTWNGCNKVFTRKSTLSIHVRTAHLGERPFECSSCGRRFAHKHLVSRHRRICSGTEASPERSASVGGSRLRFSSSRGDVDSDSSSQRSGLRSSNVGTDQDASSTSPSEDDSEAGQEPEEVVSIANTSHSSSRSIKPQLLDLLTGRGYSTSQTDGIPGRCPAHKDADDGESPTKRRRTTRGRIFACPWTKIRLELDQQMLDPALRSPSAEGTQQTEAVSEDCEESSGVAICEHRFKRLYDLRRHLHAQHGLDLTSEELSAITTRTAWADVS